MPVTDKFSNIAHLAVSESAATTLTFEKLGLGTGIFEKMAMIIHRIEYEPSAASFALLDVVGHEMAFAWTTSDQISGLAKDSAQVIDRVAWTIQTWGTMANAEIINKPLIHDFSNLPSGGLIVPATDLYLAAIGTSLGSATYCRSTIYFTYRSLKGDEFWELVEATRALT